MGEAVFAVPNFLNGEISQFAQGRFDKPEYRFSLNVCLNAFPVEIGVWVRRPGTQFGGATRGGAAGRTIKFDFNQATPYTLEFTDGYLRFRNGAALVVTDAQPITAISSANPAVVQTSGATTWATGNCVIFSNLGTSMPLLQNRQFNITVSDTTHFSLTDALTGATINGSTLGALPAGATVSRVQELATVYTASSWANVRAVQAETTDVLLNGSKAPQILTVPTLPSASVGAVFAINPVNFLDGPYLDPVKGSVITPSAVSGLIDLSLSFEAYSATSAYITGAYVMSGGIGYRSLQDANVNHAPNVSPTYWAVASPREAVSANGFVASDIGRLIRLYNPTAAAAYSGATTYNKGDIVTASSVGYRSLVSGNLNQTPASSPLFWEIYSPGWTWGKVTALSTTGLISPGALTKIGDMTQNGGLAAAFDGNLTKTFALSSALSFSILPFGVSLPLYTGLALAAPQAIGSVICTPSTDAGFGVIGSFTTLISHTLRLRASATPPASATAGTILAQATITYGQKTPVTLISNDQVTTYNYVWVENFLSAYGNTGGANGAVFVDFAQLQFFTSSGAPGVGVTVQMLGPQLPNTTAMVSWRLGVYSDTTGYPNCGTYHEGRIWLSGAVANRFDASVSNGISGSSINFAPTDQSGAVAASNAISYTLNSDDVNPIFWMQPDLQGIILGTQAAEWLVVAPTTGPLAPANISARRVTKIGSANIEPRRTENTTVFVQRYGQKLMEYFPDVYSGKFSAPNLADKAQHITRAGMSELAYQHAVTPIIWGRDALGALFGLTYKRDSLVSSQGPAFAGWHRHTLGSGRVVESLCSGPSSGGSLDTLTMVTNDPLANVRHVELLTNTPDEQSALTAAWFLDSAIAPSSYLVDGTAITGAPYGGVYLYGLWHLNGKTVQVFAGGLDCGARSPNASSFTDFVVANGATFVPFGDGISAGCGAGLFTSDYVASFTTMPIVVGLTYTSDGQLVRSILPQDTGSRQGIAFGMLRRVDRVSMLLNNTLGLSIGTKFAKLFPALFKKDDGQTNIDALTTFSGVYQNTLQDDLSYDGMVCWRITRPYPANIVLVSGNIKTQEQ